jgi:hypothetical protein
MGIDGADDDNPNNDNFIELPTGSYETALKTDKPSDILNASKAAQHKAYTALGISGKDSKTGDYTFDMSTLPTPNQKAKTAYLAHNYQSVLSNNPSAYEKYANMSDKDRSELDNAANDELYPVKKDDERLSSLDKYSTDLKNGKDAAVKSMDKDAFWAGK